MFDLIAQPGAREIGEAFRKVGFDARFVGGCVRDSLHGSQINDIDFATDACPQKVMEIAAAQGWQCIPTGLKHGTVTLLVQGNAYEVTTLRLDQNTDGRHADVQFIQDWRGDAERRDFTMNAMYVDIDGKLYDYFGGREDLEKGRVAFVGDADLRIKEDLLRILRFFRFSMRFSGDTTPRDAATLDCIEQNAPGMTCLSGQRLRDEMLKMLKLPPKALARELPVMVARGVAEQTRVPFDLDGVDRALEARRAGAEPIAVLARLMRPDITADHVFNVWRLKTADAAVIEFIQKHSDMRDADLRDFQALIARKGANQALVCSFLRANGRAEDALAFTPPPVFPIKGGDLVREFGLKPGPEVGAMVEDLREIWIENNYFQEGAGDGGVKVLLQAAREKMGLVSPKP